MLAMTVGMQAAAVAGDSEHEVHVTAAYAPKLEVTFPADIEFPTITALPHDSPYWRARHPEESERETRLRAAMGMVKLERADALPDAAAGTGSDSAADDGKGAG